MSRFSKRVGKNIRRLRKEKGWSQTELAKRIGSSYREVSRWETGRVVPGLETAARIAKALESSIDRLAI